MSLVRSYMHNVIPLIVTANVVPSSLTLSNLMMEAIHFSERRFLQEPHGVTFQTTAFFIVTAVKT
jgi:hypothetical protein